MKTYLPLGSIVVLKGATKKMMIYGRAQVAKASGKMYDYVACLYPQGFVNADMLLGFNEELFTGYTDEENEAYVKRMNELIELRLAAEEAAKAAQAEKAEQTEQAQAAEKEEQE